MPKPLGAPETRFESPLSPPSFSTRTFHPIDYILRGGENAVRCIHDSQAYCHVIMLGFLWSLPHWVWAAPWRWLGKRTGDSGPQSASVIGQFCGSHWLSCLTYRPRQASGLRLEELFGFFCQNAQSPLQKALYSPLDKTAVCQFLGQLAWFRDGGIIPWHFVFIPGQRIKKCETLLPPAVFFRIHSWMTLGWLRFGLF